MSLERRWRDMGLEARLRSIERPALAITIAQGGCPLTDQGRAAR